MNTNHTITAGDRRSLNALADRIEASHDAPIPIDGSAAGLLRTLVVGYRQSSAPVAYQIRRLDAEAPWEPCTQELYEDTRQTGRYGGFKKGPPCEVRALGVIDPIDQEPADSNGQGS